jgi:hypothetical protein
MHAGQIPGGRRLTRLCGRWAFCLGNRYQGLRPLAAFEADMERMIDKLKATPRQPGEVEALSDARLRAKAKSWG